MLLFSCSEFESVPDAQVALETQAVKLGLDPKDPGLNFAAALSNGLKDESVRKFVSENIQDQFDGDLNFLYYTTKGESLGGPNSKSITFEEALFGSQSNFRTTEPSLEFDPLMQVALRGPEEQLIDFSEIEEGIPVLYIAPEQDLEANPFVPMISEDGSVSEYDTRIVPEIPVLVISQNERLVKVPKNPAARIQSGDACLQSATPYFSDGTNDYYFYTDAFCDGGGGIGGTPGGGSGGGSTGCDRDLNTKSDHVNQIKFESMSAFDFAEPWIDGAPELFFFVLTGSGQAHLQQLRKNVTEVDRSQWKDCGLFSCVPEWHFVDIDLFHWERPLYAKVIKFQWFERDGGNPFTFKTGTTIPNPAGGTLNTEISLTISNNDDNLGEAFVNYCDLASFSNFKIHSTSTVLFGLRLDD